MKGSNYEANSLRNFLVPFVASAFLQTLSFCRHFVPMIPKLGAQVSHSYRTVFEMILLCASFEAFTVMVCEVEVFLRCDAVWCCGRIPTFRRWMMFPSSGVKWRYRQQGPPKLGYSTTTLHGVTTQKTWSFVYFNVQLFLAEHGTHFICVCAHAHSHPNL